MSLSTWQSHENFRTIPIPLTETFPMTENLVVDEIPRLASSHHRGKLSQVRSNEVVTQPINKKKGYLTVQLPRDKENIVAKTSIKDFVLPQVDTSIGLSRKERSQQIRTVMSYKSIGSGMKAGMIKEHSVTKGHPNATQFKGAKPMVKPVRRVKSDTSNPRRTEEKITKSNKNLDLKKVSSSVSTLRNQRPAIKTTGELAAKPILLSKRAEASASYDKRTKLGTQLSKMSEPWSKPKLSPLPLRRNKRGIAYLQRPSSTRSTLSHEDFNRHRSASEPVRVQVPSTPKDHQASKKETGTAAANASETSLPTITIDEIFQSWKVTPPRGRAGTLNSDPMEHLRRDWALSNPVKSNPYEEVRNCRYLRPGKSDEACAEQSHCSCNSCEHADGLRKSPYIN